MSALSVTAIVIIATTIGGALSLAGIIGAFLLARRHMPRHTQIGNDEQQSDALNSQCFGNNIRQDNRTPQPLSFERLFKHREKALIRYPGFSQLLHRVIPSRQDSVLQSDWAVRNGGHVPRPHRLKKSKFSAGRDSWLLSGIGSSRPAISRIETDIEEDNLRPKQARTVKAKIAKISGPSGKSHVVSMIVTPEYDDSYRNLRYQDDQAIVSKTRVADLRKSWLSSEDPQRDTEQQNNKFSIDIPGAGSSQRTRNRRSMSLPFTSSSRPPSTAIPPVPVPAYSPRLFIPKRTHVPEVSPSKRSFASRTTVGSSIFDGLSPSLTNDLRQISAGIKRSESRRMMRRRSSAPSLQMRSFLLDDRHQTMDVLARRPSGASSQLLPSPARPLLRNRSQGTKIVSALQSRPVPPMKAPKPCLSSEGFQLRTRDTPISLIGLEADWDVFGYEDQMIDMKNKAEGGESITRKISRAHKDVNDHEKRQLQQLQTPKPKVLQKKWTKQESYLPLSFAAVPYSSTVSLDTPLRMPVLDNQASSVYSVPSALPLKSKDQASLNGNSSSRSITSPFPFSKQPSDMVLNTLAKDDSQSLSPMPGKRLFGPRQMSPVSSRVSSSEYTGCHQDTSQESEIKSSKHQIIDNSRQSIVQSIDSAVLQHRQCQFKDIDSVEEHKVHQPEPVAQNPRILAVGCKTLIDPPPVRLDPTPLRQSFYGYEAVPNVVLKPCSINNTGPQPIALPRPVSTRSVAAPRPPSSLSNNFRASVISQPVSCQSSTAKNRLSNRGSTHLASPQSSFMISEFSRPTSTEYMYSISENDDPTITKNSSGLETEQRFSASATPLKNYSELCNLFPQPLSINSGSRPPTWVFAEKQETSSNQANSGVKDTYFPSPRSIKPGLPPHPRYFLDQQRNRTSANSISQSQHQPSKQNKSNSSTDVTTAAHSPTRKGHARMLTTSTQTTPSLTHNPHHRSSYSTAAHIPAYQSDKVSTLSLINSLNHTNSSYKGPYNKPIHRTSILEPISVNISAPTPFTANEQPTNTNPSRYREPSPSPSSQGSTTKSNHNPPTNPAGATGTTRPIPPNLQLKQRIKQAQQRRLQAQAHAQVQVQAQPRAQNNTDQATSLIGLGITISPSTSRHSSITSTKRKAESSAAEAMTKGTCSNTGSKRQRSSGVPSDIGKESGRVRMRTSYRGSVCRENGIEVSYAFKGGRLSASPGRIWKDECF